MSCTRKRKQTTAKQTNLNEAGLEKIDMINQEIVRILINEIYWCDNKGKLKNVDDQTDIITLIVQKIRHFGSFLEHNDFAITNLGGYPR